MPDHVSKLFRKSNTPQRSHTAFDLLWSRRISIGFIYPNFGCRGASSENRISSIFQKNNKPSLHHPHCVIKDFDSKYDLFGF
jgi:hypothetical protein